MFLGKKGGPIDDPRKKRTVKRGDSLKATISKSGGKGPLKRGGGGGKRKKKSKKKRHLWVLARLGGVRGGRPKGKKSNYCLRLKGYNQQGDVCFGRGIGGKPAPSKRPWTSVMC